MQRCRNQLGPFCSVVLERLFALVSNFFVCVPCGLSLADRETFFAVEPIDPVDPRRLALAAQQDEEPPPLGTSLRDALPGSG